MCPPSGHFYVKFSLHWALLRKFCPPLGHLYAKFALHWGTCTQNLPSIGALVCEICPPQGHMHTKFCLTKRDSRPKSRAPWSRWVGHGPCGRPFVSAPALIVQRFKKKTHAGIVFQHKLNIPYFTNQSFPRNESKSNMLN